LPIRKKENNKIRELDRKEEKRAAARARRSTAFKSLKKYARRKLDWIVAPKVVNVAAEAQSENGDNKLAIEFKMRPKGSKRTIADPERAGLTIGMTNGLQTIDFAAISLTKWIDEDGNYTKKVSSAAAGEHTSIKYEDGEIKKTHQRHEIDPPENQISSDPNLNSPVSMSVSAESVSTHELSICDGCEALESVICNLGCGIAVYTICALAGVGSFVGGLACTTVAWSLCQLIDEYDIGTLCGGLYVDMCWIEYGCPV